VKLRRQMGYSIEGILRASVKVKLVMPGWRMRDPRRKVKRIERIEEAREDYGEEKKERRRKKGEIKSGWEVK